MINTQAHNVLTSPTRTVYLNEPMDRPPEEEDKTEPLEPSENGEPTSANLTQEEQTYKKRFDDATKYIRDLKASTESQINELKTQKSELTNKLLSEKVTAPDMPKTPDEFKAFQEKYPELAAHILTAATMVSKDTSTAVSLKLKELEDKQNAVDVREGIIELKKYHPDFETIKDDPRFHEWFKVQLPEVQAIIKSPNPKVVAMGLDIFKEFAGIKTPSQKTDIKKDATREVKAPTRVQIGEGQKRTYTNAEIKSMSIKEFAKLEADIVAAQYDGRIVG